MKPNDERLPNIQDLAVSIIHIIETFPEFPKNDRLTSMKNQIMEYGVLLGESDMYPYIHELPIFCELMTNPRHEHNKNRRTYDKTELDKHFDQSQIITIFSNALDNTNRRIEYLFAIQEGFALLATILLELIQGKTFKTCLHVCIHHTHLRSQVDLIERELKKSIHEYQSNYQMDKNAYLNDPQKDTRGEIRRKYEKDRMGYIISNMLNLYGAMMLILNILNILHSKTIQTHLRRIALECPPTKNIKGITDQGLVCHTYTTHTWHKEDNDVPENVINMTFNKD